MFAAVIHTMSDDCVLPDDLIGRLGRASYRVRQLLRLTCRRYFNLLNYCAHGLTKRRDVDTFRATCIESIFKRIMVYDKSYKLSYKVVVEGPCIHIRNIAMPVKTSAKHSGICLLINDNNQQIAALCLRPLRSNTLAITLSLRYPSVDLVIGGRYYKLVSLNHINALDYMYDHLPELYSVSAIDV